MSQKVEKDKSNSGVILIIALLFGATLSLFLYFAKQEKQAKVESFGGVVSTESVNRHLQYTQKRMDLEREWVAQKEKSSRNLIGAGKSSTSAAFKNLNGLDLTEEKSGKQLMEELDRGSSSARYSEDPAQLVQKKLAIEQQQQEMLQAYRQEYNRQFVENARKNGWEIRLDENSKIISAKPVRRPSQEGPQGSGAGGH